MRRAMVELPPVNCHMPAAVSEKVRGHKVRITASWVGRNGHNGLAHTIQLTCMLDGRRVSRALLYRYCGDEVKK
jgi:hypothetical protein